jgi:multiple sugar transport system ATP-binding protein
MAAITYDGTTRVYAGGTRAAVDHLGLEIRDGEFMVLVGPSGCGKTTSLRMLAGLEGVDEGAIRIGDRDVTHLPPSQRDIAMVFQNYALYPHMTVRENIGYHLKIRKTPKAEAEAAILNAAEMLDLVELLDRRPANLSGGQRQRVAMGRAIVRRPAVFLMDEPLSNLDAQLRVQTRTQIASLQRRLGTTTLYVTHDQVEAMTMGDRVAVLKDGVLQQCGAPQELFARPANTFVAGFIGSPPMNLMTAPVEAGMAVLGDHRLPMDRGVEARLERPEITVGVRPESLVITTGAGLAVDVGVVEILGSDAYAYGTIAGASTSAGFERPVVIKCDSTEAPSKGARLTVTFDPASAHYFDAITGERL